MHGNWQAEIKGGNVKRSSKTGVALLVTIIGTTVLFFPACDQPGGGNGEPDPISWIDEIDWGSHAGDNIGFIVSNPTDHRLVAFAERVTPEKLLGGVPAGAENHGVHRDPGVFNRTRTVTVVLVGEDELRAHYAAGTLSAMNPFTSIMVFYNHGGPVSRHTISDRLGGRHRITVNNPTDHNVEFRLNSQMGLAIGFSPRFSHSSVIYFTDSVFPVVETLVFPVFLSFNPDTQAITEIFPLWPQGGPFAGTPWFVNMATATGLPAVNVSINVQNILVDISMALDAVCLVIENAVNIDLGELLSD